MKTCNKNLYWDVGVKSSNWIFWGIFVAFVALGNEAALESIAQKTSAPNPPKYIFNNEEAINLDKDCFWKKVPTEYVKAKEFTAQSRGWEDSFVPESELGKKLWEIRKRAITNGMELRSSEEIFEEIEKLRGEYA